MFNLSRITVEQLECSLHVGLVDNFRLPFFARLRYGRGLLDIGLVGMAFQDK